MASDEISPVQPPPAVSYRMGDVIDEPVLCHCQIDDFVMGTMCGMSRRTHVGFAEELEHEHGNHRIASQPPTNCALVPHEHVGRELAIRHPRLSDALPE